MQEYVCARTTRQGDGNEQKPFAQPNRASTNAVAGTLAVAALGVAEV